MKSESCREEMVRTWFCTYLWQHLQDGWCCCQAEFGATFCKVLWEVRAHASASTNLGLFLHFPPRHMTSLTGSESELCRRGHHLAIDVLSVLFLIHVAHPSQGSSRDMSVQTSYSILGRSGRISKCNERQWKGSGKAWQTQWKFLSFFLKKARIILIL